MPNPTRRTSILQIRVIGPVDQVHALLAHLEQHTTATLGTVTTRTIHTRTARRLGHVRGYLTITRNQFSGLEGGRHP